MQELISSFKQTLIERVELGPAARGILTTVNWDEPIPDYPDVTKAYEALLMTDWVQSCLAFKARDHGNEERDGEMLLNTVNEILDLISVQFE